MPNFATNNDYVYDCYYMVVYTIVHCQTITLDGH
jgi:hypothetical protein